MLHCYCQSYWWSCHLSGCRGSKVKSETLRMSEECLQQPVMYAHLHERKNSSSVLMKPALTGKQLQLLREDRRETVLNEASKKPFKWCKQLRFHIAISRKCCCYTVPCLYPGAECIATNIKNILRSVTLLSCLCFTVFLVKNNSVHTSQYFWFWMHHSDVLQLSWCSLLKANNATFVCCFVLCY